MEVIKQLALLAGNAMERKRDDKAIAITDMMIRETKNGFNVLMDTPALFDKAQAIWYDL